MSQADNQFEHMVRQTLDQSLDDLDTETLAKISRLKYRAIEKAERKKSRKLLWGIASTIAILLIMVSFNLPQRNNVQITSADLPELNILTSAEPLDFYAEDIEFYLWFAETMETETEPPDHRPAVPTDTVSPHSSRTGETGRDKLTQLGADRISGLLRG